MSSALPSGVFFPSHAAERALLRTWPQRLWMAGFLLALCALPWAANDYLLGVLTLAGVTLVAVLGLQITIGMAGQLNLGQSAFVGVGAFAHDCALRALGEALPVHTVLHPSPASPAANRGWERAATTQLRACGFLA